MVCLYVSGRVLGRFALYNPTTKEFRNLPYSNLFPEGTKLHGFGYDSQSDDYKIVQGNVQGIGSGFVDWRIEEIFSLKSSSWKGSQAQLGRNLLLHERGEGVYWKGALHWCVVYESREKIKSVIMSFDLSEEKFQQVLSVPEVNGDIIFEGLGIHGANLFLYHGSYANYFQLWITSEYEKGGSWTNLFSVSEGISRHRFWRKIPVAYTRSGKIIFQVNVNGMILFNPEDNTYEDYPVQFGNNIEHNIESAVYMETLVSPYLDCEQSRI
ncbi:hypothetical protein BT93_H1615 [Corymbia citriodora subsp. variegata]|nr:hypothetical protein BT93_H1615 [Corymbia citriodora subsp. variegata]